MNKSELDITINNVKIDNPYLNRDRIYKKIMIVAKNNNHPKNQSVKISFNPQRSKLLSKKPTQTQKHFPSKLEKMLKIIEESFNTIPYKPQQTQPKSKSPIFVIDKLNKTTIQKEEETLRHHTSKKKFQTIYNELNYMAKNMSCQKQMNQKMKYMFNQKKHPNLIHDLNKKLKHNKSALIYCNKSEEDKKKIRTKTVQSGLLIGNEKRPKTFCLKKSEQFSAQRKWPQCNSIKTTCLFKRKKHSSLQGKKQFDQFEDKQENIQPWKNSMAHTSQLFQRIQSRRNKRTKKS